MDSGKSLVLSIQIIYEEHFVIREDKHSSNWGGGKSQEESGMMALDNIQQTLTLELPGSALTTLPEFLQQKEFDGRISLSTCSHPCVTISKQHVLLALEFHRKAGQTLSTNKTSQLQALIKVSRMTQTRKRCTMKAKYTRLQHYSCSSRATSVCRHYSDC